MPPLLDSQHFKSSKTLKWFTGLRLLSGEEQTADGEVPKFISVVYDLGAPGHGKGVRFRLFPSECCAQRVRKDSEN